MHKISVTDRILFLLTAIVAGIKIVRGMEQHSALSTAFYTISFGVLVLTSLMLFLFGFELLANRFVPVVTTLIPATLSIGLVHDHLPQMTLSYSLLIGLMYIVSIYVRFTQTDRTAALVLALVHGLAGLLVFVLPIILVADYGQSVRLLWISIGGLLIGIEGIFLALLKMGHLNIDQKTIFSWFPVLLLAATVAFVGGLNI